MRISSLSFVAALPFVAACAPESGAPDGKSVDCALGYGARFASVCTLETVATKGDTVFVIHHPDGVHRRFVFDTAQGELVAADGAEAIDSFIDDGVVQEIAVSGDRYRVSLISVFPDP